MKPEMTAVRLRLLRLLPTLSFSLALFFIVLVIHNHWPELQNRSWQISSNRLLLSALFMLISWLLEVTIWRTSLGFFSMSLPFLQAMRVWFLSAIMRYIPGNIWQPVSITLYCRQQGIPIQTTLTSVLLYQLLSISAGIPFVLLYFWIDYTLRDQSRVTITAITALFQVTTNQLTALAISGLLLLFIPFLLYRQRRWIGSRINRFLLHLNGSIFEFSLSISQLSTFFFLGLLQWITWGISFATLTLAFYTPPKIAATTTTIQLIIAYPPAYVVGFLSLITPSGFGVREGILYFLTTPPLPADVAVVAALLMRLWTLVGEIMLALLFLIADWLPTHQPASLRKRLGF